LSLVYQYSYGGSKPRSSKPGHYGFTL